MARNTVEISTQGVVRCGVGARLYDSLELPTGDLVCLGRKLARINGRKIILNRKELIRLLRMVNDLPEEFEGAEVVVE